MVALLRPGNRGLRREEPVRIGELVILALIYLVFLKGRLLLCKVVFEIEWHAGFIKQGEGNEIIFQTQWSCNLPSHFVKSILSNVT